MFQRLPSFQKHVKKIPGDLVDIGLVKTDEAI